MKVKKKEEKIIITVLLMKIVKRLAVQTGANPQMHCHIKRKSIQQVKGERSRMMKQQK